MARSTNPNEDTEPRVQPLFVGLCRETGIGPQGPAGAGLSVFMPHAGIIYPVILFVMESKNPTKKLCPHCKQEVDPKASRCPHCQGKIPQFTKTKVIGFGIFIVLMIGMINSIVSSSTPTLVTAEDAAQQAAEFATWQKSPAGLLCAKHTEWLRKDCDRAINKDIWVGMPLSVLVYYYGAPDSDNVSNYGRGDRHQYCWDRYNPSCFYDNNGDGRIESYN